MNYHRQDIHKKLDDDNIIGLEMGLPTEVEEPTVLPAYPNQSKF